MAFTYDLSTDIGKLRLRIGDTVEARALLTDEELQVVLDTTTDEALSTIYAIDFCIAQLAVKIPQSAAGISGQGQVKFDQYEKLRKIWEKRLGRGPIQVFSGGQSKSRADSYREDSDFVQRQFSVGMDDNGLNQTDGTRSDD